MEACRASEGYEEEVAYARRTAKALVGFSILDCTGNGDAEFYVAIHTNKIRKGYGKLLIEQTLNKAFEELDPGKVHLKVRANLQHRIEIYESVGFVSRNPNAMQVIYGKDVEFKLMEITKAGYAARYGK